jgi:hypothetical protein
MADYPATGTIFDNPGSGGSTRTGLSTQVIVYVNGEPVGAIQSFQETQTRPLKRIGEVGTDGFIEIVPQSQTQINLQVQRIVFDGISLPESFARGFRNIHAQRIPFDIVVIDKFTGVDERSVVTTYHNCFFASLGKTYSASDYVISENAQIQAEYMTSQRGNQAVVRSQGVGGSREIGNKQIDPVEVRADRGRRGSLDVGALIRAQFSES